MAFGILFRQFTPTLSGVVPPSGGNPSDVLHADAAWSPAGGSGTVTSISAATGIDLSPDPIVGAGSVSIDDTVLTYAYNTTHSVTVHTDDVNIISGEVEADLTSDAADGVVQLSVNILASRIRLYGAGSISGSQKRTVEILAGVGSGATNAGQGGTISMQATGATGGNQAGGDITMATGVGNGTGRHGQIIVTIPAADPHITGALYAIAGVVNVSAG